MDMTADDRIQAARGRDGISRRALFRLSAGVGAAIAGATAAPGHAEDGPIIKPRHRTARLSDAGPGRRVLLRAAARPAVQVEERHSTTAGHAHGAEPPRSARDGECRSPPWEVPWRPSGTGPRVLARATDATGAVQPDVAAYNELGYLFGAVVRHPVTVVRP